MWFKCIITRILLKSRAAPRKQVRKQLTGQGESLTSDEAMELMRRQGEKERKRAKERIKRQEQKQKGRSR